MNDPDHISEILETMFWVELELLKFFDVDPGSGIQNGKNWDMGSRMEKIRIRDKHSVFKLRLICSASTCTLTNC